MNKLSAIERDAVMAELPALRRFCLSLVGQPADADDLLQTTIERVLKSGVPDTQSVGKWMFSICKNLWIDELRYRKVRTAQPHEETIEAYSSDEVEKQAGGQKNISLVLAAIDTLPEEQRVTLCLVGIEQKSYAEAAEILGVPMGTVMSRVARSRRTLADHFKHLNIQEVG